MFVQQPGYSSRILFFLLTAATLLDAAVASAQPVRLAAELGDERSEIEVRDLRTDKGKAAIQAAFAEMTAMLELVEGPGTNQVILEAGAEPRAVDKRFGALALRAQQFCLWSNGAFGPLAGELAVQREAQRERGEGADLAAFGQALTSAQCQNIRVTAAATDGAEPSAEELLTDGEPLLSIAEGSGLDLRGWLRGFVIDRAVEILREHGVGNAWVELGPIRRGIGDGPTGEGWPVILSFPGIETPVASVYLRDQAMAIITPLTARGKRDPELVDQRNGREPRGIVAVIAVTELGIDAETLAVTVTIIGLNEGRMRLASLKPLPSALVLLGDGTGPPVRADFRWLELPQIRQPPGGR
jgi:thiamine biosynthesis lipoprotein ApbE